MIPVICGGMNLESSPFNCIFFFAEGTETNGTIASEIAVQVPYSALCEDNTTGKSIVVSKV